MNSILVIVPTTRMGGAEQYLRMIATFYANAGFKVRVLFLKRELHNGWVALECKENIELVYLNSRNSEILGWPFFFAEVIKRRRERYRYIFTSHVHINSVVGILRKFGLLNTYFAVGRESTSIFFRFKGIKLLVFRFLYIFGYSQIDLLICQTEKMKNQLISSLPDIEKRIRIEVIPNPIDLQFIEEKSKELIELSDKEPYIVAAGRLITLKGFDVLIEAFAELVKEIPSFKLLILGEGADRKKLTALITERNLAEKVFLVGQVDNVLPYFRKAEVCVVSSRIEGFPNVLLQMMTQNPRVVSTLCSGGISSIPLLFTCEPDSVKSLLTAIKSSLEQNVGNTRGVFDQFLIERSIGSFIDRMNNFLISKK